MSRPSTELKKLRKKSSTSSLNPLNTTLNRGYESKNGGIYRSSKNTLRNASKFSSKETLLGDSTFDSKQENLLRMCMIGWVCSSTVYFMKQITAEAQLLERKRCLLL